MPSYVKGSNVVKARIAVSSMEASVMAELIGDVYGIGACRPVRLQQIDAKHRQGLAVPGAPAAAIFAEGDAIGIAASIADVADLIRLVERLEGQCAASRGIR
jgi:hypothetical protein